MDTSNKEITQVTVVDCTRTEGKAPNDACLIMIHGLELGRRYLLKPTHNHQDADTTTPSSDSALLTQPESVIVVGRSSQADISIDDDSLSRKHASLSIRSNDHIVVRDLGSTNGTFVNDVLIKEQLLKDGDLIKIGQSIFKFLANGNLEYDFHEEIYRLSTLDSLTNIYNKRYFLETLEREVSRCARYARPLSLILLDIDFFKQVNDDNGHLAGDAVLKQLSALIASHIRKEDIFARYGGEEFGLILPEVNRPGASTLAEKLRALVQDHEFHYEGNVLSITISLGVACLFLKGFSSEDFIRIADECLYRAKYAGRNCVVYL